MLKRALNVDDKVTILKCAPGSFPAAGWIFVAWTGDPTADPAPTVASAPVSDTSTEAALKRLSAINDPARLHHAVLSTTGTLLADLRREATNHEQVQSEITTWTRLETFDLDGDGLDEIVEETEYQRRAWIVGRVEVSLLKGTTLTSALSLQTSYNNSGFLPKDGPTNCKATWSVSDTADARHRFVVTAKVASGPRADEECLRGTKSYELRGSKLVVVP